MFKASNWPLDVQDQASSLYALCRQCKSTDSVTISFKFMQHECMSLVNEVRFLLEHPTNTVTMPFIGIGRRGRSEFAASIFLGVIWYYSYRSPDSCFLSLLGGLSLGFEFWVPLPRIACPTPLLPVHTRR